MFRLLEKPLHGRFHGPEDQRWLGQPNHFQCTNRLVQLLARDAKLTGVHGGQVNPA